MKTKPCHCCNGTGTEMDHAAIGKRCRDIRVGNKISLRELARQLGYSAAYLSDLEKGKRNWRRELIEKYEEL